jgi:hypothetical protein
MSEFKRTPPALQPSRWRLGDECTSSSGWELRIRDLHPKKITLRVRCIHNHSNSRSFMRFDASYRIRRLSAGCVRGRVCAPAPARARFAKSIEK